MRLYCGGEDAHFRHNVSTQYRIYYTTVHCSMYMYKYVNRVV